MVKPDVKRVDVSHRDVYEVKIGDRDSVLLSEAEASQLYERLKTALPVKEAVAATQISSPTATSQSREETVVPTSEARQPVRMSKRFTPEQRRRQNMLMSGIIIVVLGLAFVGADIHILTAPHGPSFKPPPQPYTHFTIVAGPNASFTFNGTSPGPTLKVPVNTRVWVTFQVSSGAGYPHSWVLVPGSVSPTPNPDYTPVFANANSPNPTAGSPVGSTTQIVFTASVSGSYKYICEFPGHFESGMWGWFNVTSNTTTTVPHIEHYHLVAGSNGTQTFNSTRPGPTLTAPNNTEVWLTLSIAASAATNHSWILVPGNATNSTTNYTPVFKNASSPNPTVGNAKNTTVQIYFNVTRVGNYKYISEVGSDFKAGMWGTFNVTQSNYSALIALPHSTNKPISIQSPALQPAPIYYAKSISGHISGTIVTQIRQWTALATDNAESLVESV
jgi:hypothetical protein